MSLTLTLERDGGEVSGSGTNIELDGTIAGGAIESVEMYGDTEQQTYTGKNKAKYEATYSANGIDSVLNSDGSLTCSGTTTTTYFNTLPYQATLPSVLPAGTYTFSRGGDTTYAVQIQLWDSTKNQTLTFRIPAGQTSITDTTTFDAYYYGSSFVYLSANIQINTTVKLQLESSSSPTSFEPYVGGTASPNPDYPQEVQTVTGEQTVTISDGNGQSQSYSVNLGDIELCKIGTYQDYIYKSGEDWYVHKETTNVILNGTESWGAGGQSNVFYCYSISDYATSNNLGYSPIAISVANSPSTTAFNQIATDNSFAFNDGTVASRLYWKSIKFADAPTFKTWLTNNPQPLYYALATPTDIQITNADLIAQLEALNEATTYDGTTVITVASENLVGSLEVTVATNIAKTYTEVEIGSPFTITDVEGKSSNTTLDGNVYVDWAYNKKQYSFDLFNLTPQDYADIRAFYDYQFNNSAFPTITVPELNIDKLPVYMEISSRNIINQCLLTDKLTIKFRETVQP